MVAITLPDGSIRNYDNPVTGGEVAASIGPGLAKAAMVVRVDGELWDLDRSITTEPIAHRSPTKTKTRPLKCCVTTARTCWRWPSKSCSQARKSPSARPREMAFITIFIAKNRFRPKISKPSKNVWATLSIEISQS